MNKILASATIAVGLLTSVLSLLAAFGVNITPDQHEAIIAIVGPLLAFIGAWFHPSVPIGNTSPKP